MENLFSLLYSLPLYGSAWGPISFSNLQIKYREFFFLQVDVSYRSRQALGDGPSSLRVLRLAKSVLPGYIDNIYPTTEFHLNESNSREKYNHNFSWSANSSVPS